MTIDLAERFLAAGLKVGILSRGYKRKSKETTLVVGDGCGHFATCEQGGDEPFLIAKRLPKAVVLAARTEDFSSVGNFALRLRHSSFGSWLPALSDPQGRRFSADRLQ